MAPGGFSCCRNAVLASHACGTWRTHDISRRRSASDESAFHIIGAKREATFRNVKVSRMPSSPSPSGGSQALSDAILVTNTRMILSTSNSCCGRSILARHLRWLAITVGSSSFGPAAAADHVGRRMDGCARPSLKGSLQVRRWGCRTFLFVGGIGGVEGAMFSERARSCYCACPPARGRPPRHVWELGPCGYRSVGRSRVRGDRRARSLAGRETPLRGALKRGTRGRDDLESGWQGVGTGRGERASAEGAHLRDAALRARGMVAQRRCAAEVHAC